MPYKVFIINSSKQYEAMFLERNFELSNSFKEADLVQFTGGTDVSPEYYGEHKHPRTENNKARDKEEATRYKECMYLHIPMVGICRGGQFLSVMNGGKMWQHVDGHALHGTHSITDVETKEIICEVSSTHHQMMRPFGGQVLAVAREATFLEDAEDRYGCELIEHEDVEVVFFPMTKTLCFQPHPEFDNVKECRDYYFNLLNKYLLINPPKSEVIKEKSTIKIDYWTTNATTTTNNF